MEEERSSLIQRISKFCFSCFRAMSARHPAPTYPRLRPLALELLAYQRKYNAVFKKYSEHFAKNSNPNEIHDYAPLPTTAFKRAELFPFPPELSVAEFHSSGTTTESRSVHRFRDLKLMQESIFQFFSIMATHGLFGRPRYISLMPPYEENPSSSLGFMLTEIVRTLGDDASGFAFSANSGLDLEFLTKSLRDAELNSMPVHLLGTSLAYAELLKALDKQRFSLPAGSRIMETGGNKGRKTEVNATELRDELAALFGIPEAMIYAEYSMCELSSQLYEIRDPSGASPLPEPGLFLAPPWCEVHILNPHTLEPIEDDTVGQIAIFDLCNIDSAAYVLTGDLGQWQKLNADCSKSLAKNPKRALKLLGRASSAEPKGCSLAWEELAKSNA